MNALEDHQESMQSEKNDDSIYKRSTTPEDHGRGNHFQANLNQSTKPSDNAPPQMRDFDTSNNDSITDQCSMTKCDSPANNVVILPHH